MKIQSAKLLFLMKIMNILGGAWWTCQDSWMLEEEKSSNLTNMSQPETIKGKISNK